MYIRFINNPLKRTIASILIFFIILLLIFVSRDITIERFIEDISSQNYYTEWLIAFAIIYLFLNSYYNYFTVNSLGWNRLSKVSIIVFIVYHTTQELIRLHFNFHRLFLPLFIYVPVALITADFYRIFYLWVKEGFAIDSEEKLTSHIKNVEKTKS